MEEREIQSARGCELEVNSASAAVARQQGRHEFTFNGYVHSELTIVHLTLQVLRGIVKQDFT